MNNNLYRIYSYGEIIKRLIAATDPLSGPSCYPVSICYEAGNQTEPPCIFCEVAALQSDGSCKTLFEMMMDQNTTYRQFETELTALEAVVKNCCEAITSGISYEQLLEQRNEKVGEDDDFPF